MRTRRTTRGQVEMIGLIMIVIIVIVGLLIFTVYRLTNQGDDSQNRYLNKEVATNLLISIVNTDVDECHNLSLSTILTDCARTFSVLICEEDRLSCDVANETIFNILNRTLVDWDIGFNLTVEKTNISFVNLRCREKVQGFQILPLNPGQYEMTLDICTKKLE